MEILFSNVQSTSFSEFFVRFCKKIGMKKIKWWLPIFMTYSQIWLKPLVDYHQPTSYQKIEEKKRKKGKKKKKKTPQQEPRL